MVFALFTYLISWTYQPFEQLWEKNSVRTAEISVPTYFIHSAYTPWSSWYCPLLVVSIGGGSTIKWPEIHFHGDVVRAFVIFSTLCCQVVAGHNLLFLQDMSDWWVSAFISEMWWSCAYSPLSSLYCAWSLLRFAHKLFTYFGVSSFHSGGC